MARSERQARRRLIGVCVSVLVASTGAALGVGRSEPPCAIRVDALAPGAARSIQAAIDNLPVSGPCVVTVAAGTYHEQVVIADRDPGDTVDSGRVHIKAEGRVVVDSPGNYGWVIRGSRLITIEGFVVTGAARAGILIEGSDAGPAMDVTIARSDVHNNASGIVIGPASARAWVVNSLVRNNDRNGVTLQSLWSVGAPPVLANNTIVANGWNGVAAAAGAGAYLVNNLIVGNGTAPGAAGNRFGVLRERATGVSQPEAVTLIHNVLYANGTSISGPQRGDLGNAAQVLDAGDAGNMTTSGREGPGVAGCVFRACNPGAPFLALFDPPGYGPTFRLVPGSPALGAGVGLFEHDGRNWVPDRDFDGDRRVGATIDVGYDQAAVAPAAGRR
jgi:hypothetical protein